MADRVYPLFRGHFAPGFEARTFRAIVTHVVDGDTVDALVDLGFGVSTHVTLRLRNINAPEIRGVDESTRLGGLRAWQYLRDRVEGKAVVVYTYRDRTSFGRYVAELRDADGDVGAAMVERGLAAVA